MSAVLLGITVLFALPPTTAISAEVNAPVFLEPIDVSGLTPASIDNSAIVAGLSVVYYKNYFKRHLMYLPENQSSEYPSYEGQPILQLNHQFGNGLVFGSGTNRGIGMRLTGFIYFEKTGMYEMQAFSNDGVLVYLDGQKVINDPEQHSDRLSNSATITIAEAGWYRTKIEYFQRKGTATLKLMWKPPGSSDYSPLPASVYGHIP